MYYILLGFSDVADALWISDLDDAVTGIQSSNGRQVLDRVRGIGEKLHAIGEPFWAFTIITIKIIYIFGQYFANSLYL